MAKLGTANLHSIPQPQVPQNRKKWSASLRVIRGNFLHFCNRICTLHFRKLRHNIYCYFVLVMTFFIFGGQILPSTSKKKWVITSRTLTSNSENKSFHFFQTVLPQNSQHCLLLWGFAVNFSFSPQIRKYLW